jgi:teichuronic acid biosynthesis glycosyltransferase TuaG
MSLVSVIIPCYNSKSKISRTLEMIFSQTYKNIEVIVVDDYSTDNSVDIVKSFNDSRLKLIELKINKGAGNARNVGIKFSKGDVIAFCDSDDTWRANKIERQLQLWDRDKYIGVCSAYDRVVNNVSKGKVIPREEISHNRLLKYCDIGTSTVLLNSKVFSLLKFDKIRMRQDYDLWLRISNKFGKFYGINESLVKYHIYSDSISSNKFKAVIFHYKILSRNLDFIHLRLYYLSYYILYNLKKRVKEIQLNQ